MRAFFFTAKEGDRKPQAAKQCPFCGRETTSEAGPGLLTCNPCNELADWFPRGISYALTGDSGTGKSLWLYQVADFYVRSSSPRIRSVFVTFDVSPGELRQQAAPYIKDLARLEKEGHLLFVDGYSAVAGLRSKEDHAIVNPTDMGELVEKLTTLAGEGYQAFFIDSLAPLAAIVPLPDLSHGLLKLAAKIKEYGGTVLFTAPPRATGQDGTLHPDHFSDAHIEFRRSESLTVGSLGSIGLGGWLRGVPGHVRQKDSIREFRFYKTRGRAMYPHWIPFVVGKDSILMVFPEDKEAMQRMKDEKKALETMSKAIKATEPLP